MTELLDKRIRFTRNIANLLIWVNQQPGYMAALGRDFDEAHEKLRHRKGSLHYLGLANDVALYTQARGKWSYATDTEQYRFMGEYWKRLDPDNRWGGDFKSKDGNHFSIAYGGRA